MTHRIRLLAAAAAYALLFSACAVLLWFPVSGFVRRQSEQALNQEWGASLGFLHLFRSGPDWFYDPYNPEESLIVTRLSRMILIADDQGRPFQQPSHGFQSIGMPDAAVIRADIQRVKRSGHPVFRRARDNAGQPWLLRAGLMWSREAKPIYVALGRPIAEEERILREFRNALAAAVVVLTAISVLIAYFTAGPHQGGAGA